MISRGPVFPKVEWLGSSPTPSPLSQKQLVSLSQSFCVSPVELTGANHIRPRESLALYKSLNSLCVIRWRLLSWLTHWCCCVQTRGILYRHNQTYTIVHCVHCTRTRQVILGTGSCLDSSVHWCSPSYVSHVHAGHLLHHPRHPHHDIQHLQHSKATIKSRLCVD